ncbi:MAG: hypothetical protein IT457_19705 [Planctomycetes bacterium]|nr:hypothetical protein [Planctomycetota bacterium]
MRRRRMRGLFDQLVGQAHLDAALLRTIKGKRRRPDVAAFLLDGERTLARIEARLQDGTWRPGPYSLLFLHEPKPRLIARASVADRVVHSAVAMLLEPIILRSASEADYACRRGFGTHRAVLALLRGMREHRFVVHLDVRSYFPSIVVERVLAQLSRRIDDDRLLALLQGILAAGRGLYDSPRARHFARIDPNWPPPGRGLPMGSVTSQLFATHLYLQSFDHHVKRGLKVGGYLRYVDDLFLFGDSRARLRSLRQEVGGILADEYELRLKHPQAPLLSCRGTLDALGARIRRSGIEPLPEAMARFRALAWDWVRGRGAPRTRAAMERSVASRLGLLFRF